ncbi:hypothetical protein JQX13_16495 [Archangium violaceum]|uniref:hypothetical protein n=1 Tax=Archangium violaceum TaxID=83451 RepID=UPI00193C60DA|nr:hypothetical protein [Archangium violaceum]QRK11527.1 hypothetical protein JQX13_16495 [Archangium violaceum]
MVTNATRLVDRLKGAAVRMGTEGVRYVVEGTITAVKVMDRLQELLPRQEQVVRVARVKLQEEPELARPVPARPEVEPMPSPVREQAQATAERVLEEAQAVQERIKKARPARNPLKVSVEADAEAPKRRTRSQGRKTTASATAPKRAAARKEGFKAKRGQKHD